MIRFLAVLLALSALAAAAGAQPRVLDLREEEPDARVFAPSAGDFLTTRNLRGGSAHGSDGLAAGDLDGDGLGDLIAGATEHDPFGAEPPTGPGRVEILRGPLGEGSARDLAASPAELTILGPRLGDAFGATVLAADLNGDGALDLVASARNGAGPDGSRPGAGAVHVLFGPLTFGAPRDLALSPAEVVVHGAAGSGFQAGDELGLALAVGDLNGDGRADLAMGAPYQDGVGVVHVLFGPLSAGTVLDLASDSADFTLRGRGGRLGLHVAIGDLDGDGLDDLAASAPFAPRPGPGGAANSGEVAVLLGPLPTGGSRDLALSPADLLLLGEAGTQLGHGLAAGDLSSDGAADLALGRGEGLEAVRVFFGPLPAGPVVDLELAAPDLLVMQPSWGVHFGEWTVKIADASGDGRPDLLAGSHWAAGPDGLRDRAGAAFLIAGPLGPGLRDLQVEPAELIVHGALGAGDYISGSLAIPCGLQGDGLGLVLAAGDVSGDGAADLLLGRADACGPDFDRRWSGEALVVFGEGGCSDLEGLRRRALELELRTEGWRRSILAKLDAAAAALERGDSEVAASVLCALLHELHAQAGGRLEAGAARDYADCVRRFRESLEPSRPCPERDW